MQINRSLAIGKAINKRKNENDDARYPNP